MAIGYEDGKDLVIQETNLVDASLPETCPYTLEQALSPDFLPEDETH
jgi:Domain of unknown function DUF29